MQNLTSALEPIKRQNNSINKLSKSEIQGIACFLSPTDTAHFSETSRFFHGINQENPVWKDKLTFEAQQSINDQNSQSAISLFQREERNRLPQYRSVAHLQSDMGIPYLYESIIMYIKNGLLSFERALSLTKEERANLESSGVQKYVNTGTLSIQRAIDLTLYERANLCYSGVQKCIDTGALSLEEALALTYDETSNLEKTSVQKYIANGALPITKALALTYNQSTNLSYESIQRYIDTGALSIEVAMDLNCNQRSHLDSFDVQTWIDTGALSIETVLALTYNQITHLENADIQKYINNTLPIDRTINVTSIQTENLSASSCGEKAKQNCVIS